MPKTKKAEERLEELGIEVPPLQAPLGAYVTAVISGHLIYVSGQLPLVKGELAIKGKVGSEVSLEQGIEAARRASINAISVLKNELGQLQRVERIVKITGYVASAPGFNRQANVLNGASELFFQVFGEPGCHSRVAVGVSELPLDSPVEIEVIAQISG
jgi:enamine deaminase RidA (YjgF/YER057c/UK114 family)